MTARNGAISRGRPATAIRAARLLLALAGLAPVAARAQDRIFVSNRNTAAAGNGKLGFLSFARQFRTGPAGGGYDIFNVILAFQRNINVRGTTTVSIRNNTSRGLPANSDLATIEKACSGLVQGSREFEPPRNVRLDPGTAYWIMAEHSVKEHDAGPLWQTAYVNDGLDPESEAGWELSQGHLRRASGDRDELAATWRLNIKVRGTALSLVTVASDGDVTEGADAGFTPTCAGDVTDSLEVAVSETGDMVAADDEGARTVTFAAGSDTATLTVPTEGDDADEPNSTVTVAVVDGDTYASGDPSLVVVADDDAPADEPDPSAGDGGARHVFGAIAGLLGAGASRRATVSQPVRNLPRIEKPCTREPGRRAWTATPGRGPDHPQIAERGRIPGPGLRPGSLLFFRRSDDPARETRNGPP